MHRFHKEIQAAAQWAAQQMDLPEGNTSSGFDEFLHKVNEKARNALQRRFIEAIERRSADLPAEKSGFAVEFEIQSEGLQRAYRFDIAEGFVRVKRGEHGGWTTIMGEPHSEGDGDDPPSEPMSP